MNATTAATEKMIFRRTNAHVGRKIIVTSENSANRHLAYGRIILNASTKSVSFSTGDRETALICLSGDAVIKAEEKVTAVSRYDAAYIPRDTEVEVTTSTTADIAEFSCDVQNRFPLQTVKFADLSNDPKLNFHTGGPASTRHVYLLLAKNIQAGRLLAGVTCSEPGNWTSWPPHEHSTMLEEMYVYFDMPAPAYGLQLVYNNTEYPELATVVRDGDAVLIPSGYHPNVAVPGHRLSFLWAMAANQEVEDRQFGVVNIQPGFDQGSSGLEKGRKD